MKRLFLLVGVIAAMISCAKSDVYDVNQSNPDVIAFDTYVDQTTKGTVFTNETVQTTGFGLMAYYTAQNYWDDSEAANSTLSFSPDFMYNQKVEYNTNSQAWSYSPLKYWPNADDDKVTFFAYAPYESTTNGVEASYTDNEDTGRPQIKFTVQEDADDMIDFVAGQNMDMVRQQEKVTFNLKHQLTRATFSAMAYVDNAEEYGADADGDGESYIVVKSMDIVNGDYNQFYTEGVYTFDNETTDNDKTDHSQDGVWTIDTTSATDYSFASIMGYNNVAPETGETATALYASGYNSAGVVLPIAQTTYSSLFDSGEYLFLLPPNGAAGLDGSIEIEIVYDIVTIDSKLAAGYSSTESTYTISLPEGTLAQGKAYDFQLLFNVTEILVEPNIVDWEDEESYQDTIDPFDGDEIFNPIEKIELGIDGKQTIFVGEETFVCASLSYENDALTSEDTLSWSADPEAYVDLTEDESDNTTLKVTGVAVGESVITVKSLSGLEESVTITVISFDGGFTTPDDGTLDVGETFEPEADDDNPEDLIITWSSSDEAIVSVEPTTGKITAVAPGTATITGTDQYGNIVFQYTVTVPDDGEDFEKIDIPGFGYLKLYGSEIYAQGYDSVDGTISLTAVRTVENATVALALSGSEGISITSPTEDITESSSFPVEVSFTATKAGIITISNDASLIKGIPVYFEATPISYKGSETIGGSTLGAVTSIAVDDSASANDIAMIDIATGYITENASYENREFKGSVISSVGTIKVYCLQASDFGLYDDTGAEANASEAIIFKSTGVIYTINGVENGNSSISYAYSINGEDVTSSNSYGIDGTWSALTYTVITENNFSFSTKDIGDNMLGTYGASASVGTSNLKASRTTTLTNIAGDTKTYTIALDQYALPVIQDKNDGTYMVDSSNNCIVWSDNDNTADLYANVGGGHNRGDTLESIYIYNCNYVSGDGADCDWYWEPMSSDSVGAASTYNTGGKASDVVEYGIEGTNISASGTVSAVSLVKYGLSVDASEETNNNWKFTVKVKEQKCQNDTKYQAYFCVKVTNDANEEVILKMRLRYNKGFAD